MPFTLVCRFHEDFHVSWATFNNTGKLLNAATHVELTHLPRQYRQLIVLIPSTDILLTHAFLPTKQRQKIIQALPYVLEENLAEDIEDLHFALGQRDATSGEQHVAIVSRQRIEAYLKLLADKQLTPTMIIPDVLALPHTANSWTITFFEELALIRTGLQTGFAIEVENLNTLFPLALAEHEVSPQQLMVLTGPNVDIPTELYGLGLPIVEEKNPITTLAWFNHYSQAINLLQGHYSLKTKTTNFWRPWWLTLILVGLLGSVEIMKEIIEFQQLQQQREQLNQQMQTLYRNTFPEAQRIVNPRVQMEQQLQQLRATLTTDQSNPHFLALLTPVSGTLSRTANLKLKQVDYHQGRLNLYIEIASFQALEQLKTKLNTLGLTTEIVSAVSRKNQVEARIALQSIK